METGFTLLGLSEKAYFAPFEHLHRLSLLALCLLRLMLGNLDDRLAPQFPPIPRRRLIDERWTLLRAGSGR